MLLSRVAYPLESSAAGLPPPNKQLKHPAGACECQVNAIR